MANRVLTFEMHSGTLQGETRLSEHMGFIHITQSGNGVMFDISKLDELIETLTLIKKEISQ